jgi:hypothetical protein
MQIGDETAPEPGYVIMIKNPGGSAMQLTGWTVAFNMPSGSQDGSDSQDASTGFGEAIEGGQSTTYQVTPNNGPNENFETLQGNISASDSCKVLEVTGQPLS